ncbi:tetratricopeptide repeat protein [Schlesneria sp. T3-172]|uniref:tetratricopeptide repeat protein n=1 Tax=Schlesneria sphaerica TaxID=3373610 RepID=UPI0037CC6446
MSKDGFFSPTGLSRSILLGLILATAGCHATSGYTQNRSGMKHYNRGNYAEARQRFARAVADDPYNPDYRYNLAMALQKQGDIGGAEKIMRHNLTIDAMHQPTYHSLAQVLNNQGRVDEAQDLVAGWAETQPYVAESNLELAFLQRESGNVTGAEQSLRNALRAQPTHPTALAHLGQIYQESGRPDLAAAYYQRSLAAKWDQPEVKSRLATLTGSTPSQRGNRRSAMMQNSLESTMMAGGPVMTSSPSMVVNERFTSDVQALTYEDGDQPQRSRSRRRGRGQQDGQVIAAYPLPNFDSPEFPGVPATTVVSGQSNEVFLPPVVTSDPNAMPQMPVPDMSTTQLPLPGNAPPLIPQADPAHAMEPVPEMTAAIPVVDPH